MISLDIASNKPMKANVPMCSWAIIAALYGTLIKLKAKVMMENCNTQFAAYSLSVGMVICVLRNHTPTDSNNIQISNARTN